MKTVTTLLILAGVMSLLFAMPTAAQVPANGISFDVSFPFFAGNAKMPAGKYRVTQPNPDDFMLLLESTDGKQSVFLECDPNSGGASHTRPEVTFNRYGTTDFLNLISGMQLLPSKAEELAAKNASAARHSVPTK